MPAAHHHAHEHRGRIRNRNRKRDLSNGNVHHLFTKRQIGNYPQSDVFGPTPLPSWVDSYDRAVADGLIPTIAPAANVNAWPSYPEGAEMDEICSWTVSKCEGENESVISLYAQRKAELDYSIYEAPDNEIGISFDGSF